MPQLQEKTLASNPTSLCLRSSPSAWRQELAGSGGDNRNSFAVVAAESVGFPRSETSCLQRVSLFQIQAGQEERGGVKVREAVGEEEVEGERCGDRENDRPGVVTVGQVEGKKSGEENMVSDQGRGRRGKSRTFTEGKTLHGETREAKNRAALGRKCFCRVHAVERGREESRVVEEARAGGYPGSSHPQPRTRSCWTPCLRVPANACPYSHMCALSSVLWPALGLIKA